MIDQILTILQKVLGDLREEAERDEGDSGRAPTVLYVSQKEPGGRRNFNTGFVLRRWKVEESQVTEMDEGRRFPDPVQIGMYYDHGRADFSILSDPPRVRVGWQVGPRYGRGYDYPILDGNLTGEAIPIWFS